MSKQPIVYMTRRETFSSAHRLHSFELSDAENQRIFAKCNNPHSHGHNYVLYVTLRGAVNAATGMVMNLVDLKRVIQAAVLQHLDHRNIDVEVAWFRDHQRVSTTENVAVFAWESIASELAAQGFDQSLLHEIRVDETENNSFVFRGETDVGIGH
eukprot:ANDGO_05882.mRNA.1 6-pyruvoyl tetrahydrobiopterin synthase